MPSTAVLPTVDDLARVDILLGLVWDELEAIESALERPDRDAARAFEEALAAGASYEEASERTRSVPELVLDDQATARLLMFLLDVVADAERIDELARKCLDRVKAVRHESTPAYDSETRRRVRETLLAETISDDAAEAEAGGDDA